MVTLITIDFGPTSLITVRATSRGVPPLGTSVAATTTLILWVRRVNRVTLVVTKVRSTIPVQLFLLALLLRKRSLKNLVFTSRIRLPMVGWALKVPMIVFKFCVALTVVSLVMFVLTTNIPVGGAPFVVATRLAK